MQSSFKKNPVSYKSNDQFPLVEMGQDIGEKKKKKNYYKALDNSCNSSSLCRKALKENSLTQWEIKTEITSAWIQPTSMQASI